MIDINAYVFTGKCAQGPIVETNAHGVLTIKMIVEINEGAGITNDIVIEGYKGGMQYDWQPIKVGDYVFGSGRLVSDDAGGYSVLLSKLAKLPWGSVLDLSETKEKPFDSLENGLS